MAASKSKRSGPVVTASGSKGGSVTLIAAEDGPMLDYAFYFCDPVQSFGQGSPGANARQLFGRAEKDRGRLGSSAWETGKKAFDYLSSLWGSSPTTAEVIEFIRVSWPDMRSFFETVERKAAAGEISIVSKKSGRQLDRAPEWRGAGISWQFTTMLHMLVELYEQRGEPLTDWGQTFAVAALIQLDDAVLASLDDSHESVVASMLEAKWMVDQLFVDDRVARAAITLSARRESDRARQRARKRHELDPKQAAKMFVLDCWRAWQAVPTTYVSKAAFARDMLDKQPDLVSTQVVERWAREWAKGERPLP